MKEIPLQEIGHKGVRSMTAFLKRHGCTPIAKHYGQHYHYHSGFFYSPKGALWYWAAGDDRISPARVLIRTAKDLKDYTGGRNQYPQTGSHFDELIKERDETIAAA